MGKAITFMIFMFIVTCIAGGMMAGHTVGATTRLTADVTVGETAIFHVASTTGFPDSGFIVIEGERISYPDTTATSFEDSFLHAMGRGESGGLVASAHLSGTVVRTIENSIVNDALQYQVATLTDTSGFMGFLSIPIKFVQLLITFFTLPLGFLGTDLEIITFIWAAVALGIITSVGLAIIGGRHV